MSLQCSASFHTCQATMNSAMNGIAVIVPVRKRSSFSFSTGWTSSSVGATIAPEGYLVGLTATLSPVRPGQVGPEK